MVLVLFTFCWIVISNSYQLGAGKEPSLYARDNSKYDLSEQQNKYTQSGQPTKTIDYALSAEPSIGTKWDETEQNMVEFLIQGTQQW